jgi:hypothetical protein
MCPVVWAVGSAASDEPTVMRVRKKAAAARVKNFAQTLLFRIVAL